MKLIYALGVRGYSFLVRIASLWNPKAKKWMQGRAAVWHLLDGWERKDVPVYWFHCASLGEFEQGRPLMEKLKKSETCQIVITFFSPSGYEIRKGYDLADLVLYLPQETSKNVNRFLDKVQPDKVFFIKYEFWATYIFEAKKRGAVVYSISAVFRKKQLFFKSIGGYMRKVLKAFDHIFVQDQQSADLLGTIGVECTLAGDTRYDRVMENARNVSSYPEIEEFIGKDKVLVVGSSWEADELVLLNTINSEKFDWKVIIAPHEIDENRIQSIESKLKKSSLRYSNIGTAEVNDVSVLIIDNIGMLMNVYQYANVAYVGGAFGKGLHNILEPACFGVPVIFGDNYAKFNEAFDFIKSKVGFSVSDANQFQNTFNKIKGQDIDSHVLAFMQERQGATAIISDRINL